MMRELEQQAAMSSSAFLVHLRRDRAAPARARPGRDRSRGRNPGLTLWHPASQFKALVNREAGGVPSLWVEAEGRLGHVAGPMHDSMIFDVPLTGTFTFSVEVSHGNPGEGEAGYSGLVFLESPGQVWSVSDGFRSRFVPRNQSPQSPPPTKADVFKRLTIAVEPGKVRFLIDGQLIYEETDPSSTSPWLSLYSGRDRRSVFRNPQLSGAPEVPRGPPGPVRPARWLGCVVLRGDGRFRPKRPPGGFHRRFDQPPTERPAPTRRSRLAAKDSVLIGRRVDLQRAFDPISARVLGLYVPRSKVADASNVESRLSYQRPLRAGDARLRVLL